MGRRRGCGTRHGYVIRVHKGGREGQRGGSCYLSCVHLKQSFTSVVVCWFIEVVSWVAQSPANLRNISLRRVWTDMFRYAVKPTQK